MGKLSKKVNRKKQLEAKKEAERQTRSASGNVRSAS